MQAMWKKVGVDITIKVGGRGVAYARRQFSRKFHAFVSITPANHDPLMILKNFHSKNRFNYFGIKDPKIDTALEKLWEARGRDARYKANCDLQQLVIDEARFIHYEVPKMTFGHKRHVKGVPKPNSSVFHVHRLRIEK
jgi:ABC-type oligopeptide transport system substrate-binding subunit